MEPSGKRAWNRRGCKLSSFILQGQRVNRVKKLRDVTQDLRVNLAKLDLGSRKRKAESGYMVGNNSLESNVARHRGAKVPSAHLGRQDGKHQAHKGGKQHYGSRISGGLLGYRAHRRQQDLDKPGNLARDSVDQAP